MNLLMINGSALQSGEVAAAGALRVQTSQRGMGQKFTRTFLALSVSEEFLP